MRQDEIKQLREDYKWWNRLTDVIEDWRLLGFTYRNSATFIDSSGNSVNLTGQQKEDIIKALK